VLGGTGGWVGGSQASPSSYLSVSNSQSIPYTPGDEYTEVVEADVSIGVQGLGSDVRLVLSYAHCA